MGYQRGVFGLRWSEGDNDVIHSGPVSYASERSILSR